MPFSKRYLTSSSVLLLFFLALLNLVNHVGSAPKDAGSEDAESTGLDALSPNTQEEPGLVTDRASKGEESRPPRYRSVREWPTKWVGFSQHDADAAIVKALAGLKEDENLGEENLFPKDIRHVLMDLARKIFESEYKSTGERDSWLGHRVLRDAYGMMLDEIPAGLDCVPVRNKESSRKVIGFHYRSVRHGPHGELGEIVSADKAQSLWARVRVWSPKYREPGVIEVTDQEIHVAWKQDKLWNCEFGNLESGVGRYHVWTLLEKIKPSASLRVQYGLAYHAAKRLGFPSSRWELKGMKSVVSPSRIATKYQEDFLLEPWFFFYWIDEKHKHKKWAITALWSYAVRSAIPEKPLQKVGAYYLEESVAKYREARLKDKFYKNELYSDDAEKFTEERLEQRFQEIVKVIHAEYEKSDLGD